jgi:hypothetical protein
MLLLNKLKILIKRLYDGAAAIKTDNFNKIMRRKTDVKELNYKKNKMFFFMNLFNIMQSITFK